MRAREERTVWSMPTLTRIKAKSAQVNNTLCGEGQSGGTGNKPCAPSA